MVAECTREQMESEDNHSRLFTQQSKTGCFSHSVLGSQNSDKIPAALQRGRSTVQTWSFHAGASVLFWRRPFELAVFCGCDRRNIVPTVGTRELAANPISEYPAIAAAVDVFNANTDAIGRQRFLSFAVCTVFGYRDSAVRTMVCLIFMLWSVTLCGTRPLYVQVIHNNGLCVASRTSAAVIERKAMPTLPVHVFVLYVELAPYISNHVVGVGQKKMPK